MELRRATMDDAIMVLKWRNDPVSVAMSKTGAVAPADHLKWFSRAVQDPDRIILIATEENRSLGVVRFDKLSDGWLVSINIGPEYRGRGYGDKALRNAINQIGDRRLVAEIKADNIASIRIFERCGFRQIGIEDGFLQFQRS